MTDSGPREPNNQEEPAEPTKNEEEFTISFEEGVIYQQRIMCMSCFLYKDRSQFRFDGDNCVDCRD